MAKTAATKKEESPEAIRKKLVLTGADIVVPDLRGGFSHLIAALAAEGASRVEGINLIDRGYEHFMSKLASLDADVSRLA